VSNGEQPALPYKECHAKFDAQIEPLDTMTLIGLQAMVKDSEHESDKQYFRAIQWELKMRTERSMLKEAENAE